MFLPDWLADDPQYEHLQEAWGIMCANPDMDERRRRDILAWMRSAIAKSKWDDPERKPYFLEEMMEEEEEDFYGAAPDDEGDDGDWEEM